MHFTWFSMGDYFSHHTSLQIPPESLDSETSQEPYSNVLGQVMRNPSHMEKLTKCIGESKKYARKIQFLFYFINSTSWEDLSYVFCWIVNTLLYLHDIPCSPVMRSRG